jgi:hypothetical protein
MVSGLVRLSVNANGLTSFLPLRSETSRFSVAKMKRLVLGVGCLHLDGKVIDTKPILKFDTQLLE